MGERPIRWTSAACVVWICGCGAGSEHDGVRRDHGAPRVVDSAPREGEVAVAADIGRIRVRFDERMDTSRVEVALAGDDTTLAVSGEWSDGGHTIEWPIPALVHGRAYRVDLAAFVDAAGNALDGSPYLGDGALDFATVEAPTSAAPHAVASDPMEGAIDPDPLRRTIAITFDEPMDTALAAVPIRIGPNSPETIAGAWSEDARVLTLSRDGYFEPGVPIRVELTGLVDLDGHALDASHPYLEDGALDFTLRSPRGHDCSDPLVTSQADIGFGFHTWNIAPSATAGADGVFACDADGTGQDVVLRYDKQSGTLAEGGALLRVFALAKGDPSQQIALEIVSDACQAGVVHKCLSSRASWDALMDAPAGSYWISVAHPVAGEPFPGAVVTVDEVPVSEVEGEGCFAPYDVTSANYTPPSLPGDPHRWTIPAGMTSVDMAPATGALSCKGNNVSVDAVVELDKVDDDSVLYIEAEKLPSPVYGSIVVWVLGGCDGAYPVGPPYGCGSANGNNGFVARPPAGRVSLWVGTGWLPSELIGAELRVTEVPVALGETRVNPEPLSTSGPIQPSSSKSFEIPSCFPPGGNVHWYSYLATGDVVGVKGDAAAPLALIGPDGFEAACSGDTGGAAIGTRLPPGSTVLIAVGSPTAISHLQIIDTSYTGIDGPGVALGITFPTDMQHDSMAVGADHIFIGGDEEIWSLPKTGGATAVVHGAAEGLGDAQLGEHMAFAAGKLFTLDDDSTSTSLSRLWAVYDDESDLWGPVAWDVPSGYPPATALRAIGHDGTDLIAASYTPNPLDGTDFFALDPNAAAAPVLLGHSDLWHVRSLAADASHLYLSTSGGIFRLDRDDLAAPPVRLSAEGGVLLVDDIIAATHLYALDGTLRVVIDPGGAAPIDIGPVAIDNVISADAMTIDRATGILYVYQDFLSFDDVYAVLP